MTCSTSPISILYIIGSTHAGGVPTCVLNIIKNLDRNIFTTVELVAPDDGPYYDILKKFITVHNRRIRGFYPETLLFIRKLIKQNRFDIVYANGRGAGIYGRLAAIGTAAKTVYSYHGFNCDHFPGIKKNIYLWFEKMALRLTDRVICVSESEKERAMKANVLVKQKAAVIPHGIDFEAARTVHREKNGFTIGLLAKVCIQKGIEYVVSALALLRERYPNVKCLIAGKTLEEEYARETRIREAIAASGMKNAVVLLGEVVDRERFFGAIDLYVSASLWEGLPIAVLEAFAYRVPVVATDVAGTRDLVVHRETGILVQPKSGRSLAEGIAFAFSNRRYMEMLAENAHHYGSGQYSLRAMVDSHQKLYKILVQ